MSDLEAYAAEQRARRERIATAVLAGHVAYAGAINPPSVMAFVVKEVVRLADALAAELDR
jgi:hypothetical protein